MEVVPTVPERASFAALRGTLLAGAALGVADGALALWCNRAIAPRATVPLCLTAPFVIWLLVLSPAALLVAALSRAGRRDPRVTTAWLLGVAGAAAAVRALAAMAAGWRGAGDEGLADALTLSAIPVAAGAALGARRAARALLARIGAGQLTRAVVLAGVTQALAVAGLCHVVGREERGAVREALRASLGFATTSEAGAARAKSRLLAELRAGTTPRNLVLITVDTLRADYLDGRRMPHATRLAASGVHFRAAYAAAPWTLPAMASLLTGLPAARHGAGRPVGDGPLARSPLPAAHATLATELARAGFETRAIVTNPYLGLAYGLGRGFEAFENVTLTSEAVLTLRPTLGFWLLTRAWPRLAIADRGDAVTSRAARFLRGRRSERRLFLWLHYVDPHAPYDGSTRSFRDDLLAGPEGTLPRMAQLRAGEIRPDAGGRAALREAYARAVQTVDREIGRVLRLFDEAGMTDDTLVVLTSDHGEELWDHGGVEHGHTLFDELIRVPLVMRCPGCRRGLEVATPVGVESLAATLLELLGVAAPRAMSPGFAALLRGAPWTPRPVVSENLLFAEERVALRTPRFTYVAWPSGKEELYDRERDPGELHDLAARRALLRRHRALLAAQRGSARPGAGKTAEPPEPAAAPADRTLRALRALGYVQ